MGEFDGVLSSFMGVRMGLPWVALQETCLPVCMNGWELSSVECH